MRLALAALVASTGCAQLFGIDDTTRADANSDLASVQVQKVSVGASVIKTPLDMSNQTATFYDDSAGTLAPIPGVQTAMDTFSASAPGTPSVTYTVPDVQIPTRLLALPARAQKANYIEFEHPNPQDPLPSSAIDLRITLPTPYMTGETFSMQAIGAWMAHPIGAADLPMADMAMSVINPAAPLPYSAFTSLVPGNPKMRITNADVFLVLRYASAKLSGVFEAQFDQTDGPDAVVGTMTVVPATSMLMATIDPSGYSTRFAAANPAVTGLGMSWRVSASPGYALGLETGVRLANGGASSDTTIPLTTYGNPFESLDWKAVFTFTATMTRSYVYMENGMMGTVGLSANMTTLSEPSTSLNLSMPAGLPILIQANDLTLVTDGSTVPLDLTKPVTIKATLDRPTNTAYEMTLTQVGLDVSGTAPVITRKVIVDAFTAGAPTFRLPPELFTTGKTYYVTFRSFQGAPPNAADGDLQTVTLPYSTASLDSAVFTVGMP